MSSNLKSNQLKLRQILYEFTTILISGMGNVKQGNWSGILVYFSFMFLFGAALIFLERKLLEPIYQVSQHQCTFAVLLYLSFTFFWDGTKLLGHKENNHIFNQDEEPLHKEAPK